MAASRVSTAPGRARPPSALREKATYRPAVTMPTSRCRTSSTLLIIVAAMSEATRCADAGASSIS